MLEQKMKSVVRGGFIVAGGGAALALWVGAVYVLVHFIVKYW